jgi:hypothetical protein
MTFLLLRSIIVVTLSICPFAIPVFPQSKPADSHGSQAQLPDTQADEGTEEVPEGELAPASLQLYESKSSPLIQALYQASRETKEDQILARLNSAKALIPSADVNATDDRGRTALHWTVFGSVIARVPRY